MARWTERHEQDQIHPLVLETCAITGTVCSTSSMYVVINPSLGCGVVSQTAEDPFCFELQESGAGVDEH
jgi:hypothetical protein